MIFDNYELDSRHIAHSPASPRDHSKLLMVRKKTQSLEHRSFYNIIDELSENDVLVFNDSRVIKARLLGTVHTNNHDRNAEVFVLNPAYTENCWNALCKPSKHFQPGSIFSLEHQGNTYSLTVTEKHTDGTITIDFGNHDASDVIEYAGLIPLPPYIHNDSIEEAQYQTVYAQAQGSVAAPTAGLHFTEELIKKIMQKGVACEFVTLHVGRGTFMPIKVEDFHDHVMHSEQGIISDETAQRINNYMAEGKRIIAVGTTAVRCLEGFASQPNHLNSGTTDLNIFIYPPYQFKIVDALITNFHLPKSTLLLLVSALAGGDLLKKAYEEALEHNYRFYSFGDAMFISEK